MADRLKPVILLVGDPFLASEKFKTLLKSAEGKFRGEIAQQTFHLSETPLEAVLAQARTLPFLAAGQVFKIDDLQKIKKADVEVLTTYLEQPSDKSVLVFQAQTLKKNDALTKLIQKKGDAYFLEDEHAQSESNRFIKEKLKTFGKTMSPGAVKRIQEDCGEFPVFLDSVLDRLIAYSGDQKVIDETMVNLFQEEFKTINVFDLTDAIASRRTGPALSLIKQLMEESNGDTIALIGLLHWQIRRFWLAKVLLEDGKPDGVIIKKCKISPRQMPYFMRQLKPFTRDRLEQTLEGLFQIDWKIKTGRVDGLVALETWVVQTTS